MMLLCFPLQITNIYGTVKAYCTRVGEGPFPTEALDEMGDMLRYALAFLVGMNIFMAIVGYDFGVLGELFSYSSFAVCTPGRLLF